MFRGVQDWKVMQCQETSEEPPQRRAVPVRLGQVCWSARPAATLCRLRPTLHKPSSSSTRQEEGLRDRVAGPKLGVSGALCPNELSLTYCLEVETGQFCAISTMRTSGTSSL